MHIIGRKVEFEAPNFGFVTGVIVARKTNKNGALICTVLCDDTNEKITGYEYLLNYLD